MIKLAVISPHPPIILPSVGSEEDRKKVQKTIDNLNFLGKAIENNHPDTIVISAPHPDWGFDVPLFFLAQGFDGEIKKYLIGGEKPSVYFKEGKILYGKMEKDKDYVLIASGDLSHRLKKEGPYGFHRHGPEFDRALIKKLQEKNAEEIMNLGEIFPEAAECGLRSFCFMLGILEAFCKDHPDKTWIFNELSYEGPFGVGYLAAEIDIVNR